MEISSYIALILAVICSYECQSLSESRPSVIILNETSSLVFHSFSGQLYSTLVKRDLNNEKSRYSTKWSLVTPPEKISFCSNPVSVTTARGCSSLFIQATNGQVYGVRVLHDDGQVPALGKWVLIGTSLPFNKDADIKGYDSVSARLYKEGTVYVFARSHSNQSSLYVTEVSADLHTASSWQLIGGTKHHLITDMSIDYNSFSKLLEAFMVSHDGYMYRTWQVSAAKWVTWTKTGWFAPKTFHRPVVHQMAHNFFNGYLNVFVHGVDGRTHHIWQTTCDHVPNPWGWCTWSTWQTVGGDMPGISAQVTNTLSVGHNIHQGIELFAVSEEGELYKMWQMQRHASYHSWEHVATSNTAYPVASLPAISDDAAGWWAAYALDSSRNLLIISQHKQMTLSRSSLLTGSEVSVSWQVPVDEASHSDWIGVFPHGSSDNHDYLDYYFVGGSQNPLKDPVPSGQLTFKTFVPKGKYDFRYIPNRRYEAAIGSSLVVTNSPPEEVWVQVYRGLFEGMRLPNVSVEQCVHDAETVEKEFQLAFDAFEDRAIFKGLRTLGAGLLAVAVTAKDCGIEQELERAMKVFKDLESCFDKACSAFLVDVLEEVIVLYENIYEVYGDIIGAKNSFRIHAYYQGGFNIGRMINGCLESPRYGS